MEYKPTWYTKDSDGDYCPHAMPAEYVDELPPGIYQPVFGMGNMFYRPKNWQTDNIYRFSSGPAVDAINEIFSFWKNVDSFRASGFVAKRSILLWGEPGTGKTCTIRQIADAAVNSGAVCFLIYESGVAREILGMFREHEPQRPVVCIIEDLDSAGSEKSLLSLLDGEAQIDNVTYLLSTNYPEKLKRRLINRPGRIDRLIHVAAPSDENRREYLADKMPALKDNDVLMTKYVSATKGYAVAHLRELVVSVTCMGQPFDSVITRLNDMRKCNSHSGEECAGHTLTITT